MLEKVVKPNPPKWAAGESNHNDWLLPNLPFHEVHWVIKGGLSDFTRGVTVAGQCWTFTSFPPCAPCIRAGGAPFMAYLIIFILILNQIYVKCIPEAIRPIA
jgi:hypothetical protein